MAPQRTRQVIDEDMHDHDRGLSFDMSTLMSRRRALGLLAFGGAAALVGCGSSSDGSAGATAAAATPATAAGEVGATEIPEETAGPFPGDGTNGPNVPSESDVVRSDITMSFGGYSGAAEGVPLTVNLTILDVADGGAPLAGAAVYIWHCDREGNYSLYSRAAADQNYLRGVQQSDPDGRLTFQSIFPACYPGRWPHIHFEVFPSLDQATRSGQKLVTSQIALPEDVCNEVFTSAAYRASRASPESPSPRTWSSATATRPSSER